MTPASLSLGIGQTQTLQALNGVGNLRWFSENESVVWVVNQNSWTTTVTALAPGTAAVYVGDLYTRDTAACIVTVTGGTTPAPTPVPTPPTLTVTPPTLSLEVGETDTLRASGTGYSGALQWQSKNVSVATVMGTNETALVTAVSAGTAQITATATDGSGATAACTVTVTAPAEEPPEPPTPSYDNWIEVADTDWYDANPNGASFVIDTAEELAGLAKLVNEETDDFSGKTIVLDGDIDLAGKQWTPVGASAFDPEGTSKAVFCGTFDGKENTITNMAVDLEGGEEFPSDNTNAGLFGYNRGTIQNVRLIDVHASSSSSFTHLTQGLLSGSTMGEG